MRLCWVDFPASTIFQPRDVGHARCVAQVKSFCRKPLVASWEPANQLIEVDEIARFSFSRIYADCLFSFVENLGQSVVATERRNIVLKYIYYYFNQCRICNLSNNTSLHEHLYLMRCSFTYVFSPLNFKIDVNNIVLIFCCVFGHNTKTGKSDLKTRSLNRISILKKLEEENQLILWPQ